MQLAALWQANVYYEKNNFGDRLTTFQLPRRCLAHKKPFRRQIVNFSAKMHQIS